MDYGRRDGALGRACAGFWLVEMWGLSESRITRITQISRIRIRLVTRLVGLDWKGAL